MNEVEVFELSHNGEVLFTGTENDCYIKLQRLQSQSADWAMKHECWDIQPKRDVMGTFDENGN